MAKKMFFLFQSGLIILLGLFSSCNNNEDSSPYGEILSSPAFASLTDSIKKQPKNDELYFHRAVLLNKNNFPEPALADFQKAWSLTPHEKYAFGLANILLDKNPDSAIAFLNRALGILPESSLLRITLTRAYDAIDKTDEALQVCNELLAMQPDQPEVLELKIGLLEKKGDREELIKALEKAYRLNTASFAMGFKLAYQYAENKDPHALTLCDTLMKKDTAQLFAAHGYYAKGDYYSNTGQPAKAIAEFDEAIRHDYNYLVAYIEKGKILVNQKKYAEAFKVFSLANTVKPAYPDAYYWMGVCQEEQGDKEEAKLNYQRAYGLDKTFAEAKEAFERLSK